MSLIYVSYAYTGWNVATYLTDELERPQRSLPRVLFVGAFGVMLLYILLNAVFLLTTPMEKMVGEVEVGVIAARHVFGQTGALFTGAILGVLLLSTVSAMTTAGPRVLQMVGRHRQPGFLSARESTQLCIGLPHHGRATAVPAFKLRPEFDSIRINQIFEAQFSFRETEFLALVHTDRTAHRGQHQGG